MSVASKIWKRAKVRLAQLVRGESGQTPLITVLVLLILGALIVAPLLTFMLTGLRSGQKLESRMQEYYAADAAVVDARWRIKYGYLPDWMKGVWDEYVYNHAPEPYTISDGVNEKDTSYTIQPIWALEDLQSPTDGINGRTPPDFIGEGGFKYDWYLELAMTTDITVAGRGKINIIYNLPRDGDLTIDRIGVWLPPGFTYVDGSSTFEQADPYAPPGENLYCDPTTSAHKGGTAVIWDTWIYADTAPNIPLSRLPESAGNRVVEFEFTPAAESPLGMFSWMIASNASNTYLCWDLDAKFYRIEAEATTVDTGKFTTVDAYTIKSEFRRFGAAIEGDYFATGGTLMTPTDDSYYRSRLYKESTATIEEDDIPLTAGVEAAWLYWSGWIEEADREIIFSDDCDDFDNWYAVDGWGHTWTVAQLSNANFRVRLTCNSDYSTRDFRLDWVPVRVYYSVGNSVVNTGWMNPTANAADTGGDNNGFESYPTYAYANDSNYARNNDGAGDRHRYYQYNLNIPPEATIIGIDVRLDWWLLDSTSGTNSMSVELSWNGGTSWTAAKRDSTETTSEHTSALDAWSDTRDSGVFTGWAYGKTNPARYLTISSSIDLSAYVGQTVEISWEQDESGDLEGSDPDRDCLQFQLYKPDGGWGSLQTAFCNDNPESPFSYTIPNDYLTDGFKMRFYLYGFSGSGEYCYIDNIEISALEPLVESAKVNRVLFNGAQIIADEWQVAPTPDSGAPDSWSYSCFYDATTLVQEWIADPDDGVEIDTNGSGTYTLGHWLESGPESYNLYPSGTTGYPLATPAVKQGGWYPTQYQWTYAGWSLIIIYSSPETEGHYLYLYEDLRYVGLDTTLAFPVSGFLVPDETEGSHLTYFVGEGDNHYGEPWVPDCISINTYYLSDAINPWYNVFNSYSNSIDDPYLSGIDIDTFDTSDYIEPGDSSAEVVLDNGEEIYNLVYLILSFRSLTTTGGYVTYIYGIG